MAVVPGTELPSPRRGGRPRDPSRDEAIRAALLRLLGEVGYGGLPMDALAQAAGVGKATIYRRWRTKQDLIVDSISDLGSLLTAPPDTQGPCKVSFARPDLRLWRPAARHQAS